MSSRKNSLRHTYLGKISEKKEADLSSVSYDGLHHPLPVFGSLVCGMSMNTLLEETS